MEKKKNRKHIKKKNDERYQEQAISKYINNHDKYEWVNFTC